MFNRKISRDCKGTAIILNGFYQVFKSRWLLYKSILIYKGKVEQAHPYCKLKELKGLSTWGNPSMRIWWFIEMSHFKSPRLRRSEACFPDRNLTAFQMQLSYAYGSYWVPTVRSLPLNSLNIFTPKIVHLSLSADGQIKFFLNSLFYMANFSYKVTMRIVFLFVTTENTLSYVRRPITTYHNLPSRIHRRWW